MMTKLHKIKKYFGIAVLLIVLLIGVSVFEFSPPELTARVVKPCDVAPLDPWDKSLTPYIVSPAPLVCSTRKPLMYVNRTGHIHLNHSRLTEYSISTLDCVYRIIVRDTGDTDVTFEPEISFSPPCFINGRFFRVICRNITETTVYDYLHINTVWNESDTRENEIGKEHGDKLSIMLFGIDSVSRSHALRNLPKTYEYLRNEFDVYDFHGYSKVGENTWRNILPMLSGRSLWSYPVVEFLRLHADSMPFLWYEKGLEKHITLFSEDMSNFNYANRAGFRRSPTDYYYRPYTIAMRQFDPVIVEPLGQTDGNCFGSSSYLDHELEYIKGFISKYKNKLKFAYFWNNQVAHDEFSTLSRGDEPLLAFIKWMKETEQVKNTIFAFLSDHGFRIGGASLTHAGRAENNRPLLLLHVPKHIKDRYPWAHNALKANTKRLISHYDTYQTFHDIIQGNAFTQETPPKVEQFLVRRNLFSPIPLDRTCADAGIEDKYCSCNEKVAIPTTSKLVHEIALKVVERINSYLLNHSNKCSTVSLHNVSEASVSYSNSDESNLPPGAKEELAKQTQSAKLTDFFFFASSKPVAAVFDRTGRYTVLLFTSPGYAYFEATVDFAEIALNGTRHMLTLVGEPSRLDRYGNQSHCLRDGFLEWYCYCKDLLP